MPRQGKLSPDEKASKVVTIRLDTVAYRKAQKRAEEEGVGVCTWLRNYLKRELLRTHKATGKEVLLRKGVA